MYRTLVIAALLAITWLPAAAGNGLWEFGTPNRDYMQSMRYGLQNSSFVGVAEGLVVSGLPVLRSHDYPAMESLTDLEVWMIAGLSTSASNLSMHPEKQSYFDSVMHEVRDFLKTNNYVPGDMNDVISASFYPANHEVYLMYDGCLRNPYTGDYPELQAWKGGAGDFFVAILNEQELQEFAGLNPDFSEMYYCGQRTVYNMPEYSVADVSAVRITCPPFYIRMYGEHGVLRDGVFWSWEYTDEARQRQFAQTGK